MPPTLRTRRLLLRSYRLDDVDDVLGYATDAEWARYLPVPDPYTRRCAEEFVAEALRADDGTGCEWAIVHEGKASGGVSLRILGSGSAELGYSLARPLWGRGLATEAAGTVIAFGFEELGLARILAVADIRNAASWRVMEKLGMEREGVVPMERPARGESADGVRYALSRDDWQRRGPRPVR